MLLIVRWPFGMMHSHRYSLWCLSLHTSIADTLSSATQTTLAAGRQLYAESWRGFISDVLNKLDPVNVFIAKSTKAKAAGGVVR